MSKSRKKSQIEPFPNSAQPGLSYSPYAVPNVGKQVSFNKAR